MSKGLRILVTGANGQLGSEFRFLQDQYPQWEFLFVTREELDLSKTSGISPYLQSVQADIIINCAAYTNVEAAEDHGADTEQNNKIVNAQNWLLNANAPRVIAEWCADNNSVLIHFSTDYVFDGKKSTPYTEIDSTHPINQYGCAKLLGENEILDTGADAIVFRVSWLYGTFGNNFMKTMIRLADANGKLSVVSDQVASPTYSRQLASDVLSIIQRFPNLKEKKGIYHYTQYGTASWFDFARRIMEYTHRNIPVSPVTSDAFPTKAVRPVYSKLDSSYTEQTFGLKLPHWEDCLKECINDLKS